MRHPDHSCLPFLLLFLLPPLLCGAAKYTYYVKPTNNTPCPADSTEPCLTLMQYVQNASEYFKSSAAMIFLPGNHTLKLPLVVSNVTNLTLISANGTHNTTILCRDENFTPYNAYLHFNDTENLIIDGLRFLSCGTAHHNQTESLMSLGTLQLTNVVNIQVSNISVEGSLHEGIRGINAFLGKSSITCSCFHDNGGISPHVSIRLSDSTGAVPVPGSNTLTIEDTVLVHGTGGAISLALAQHGYSVDVRIINMSTTGCAPLNHSELETGIDISLDAGPYPNSSVYIGTSSISNHSFGGISIRGTFSPNITIENTIISWNHGRRTNAAGLTLIGNSQPVTFRNVTFDNNSFYTPRLSTTRVTVMLFSVQNVRFYDCEFRSNTGSVALRSSTSVNFADCNFLSNYDSSVLVDNSNFTVSGTVNFTGNHGVKGGALALYENSHMLLENNTILLFTANSATGRGGAIYVDETDALWDTQYNCFIIANPLASNISLVFTNNTAECGGSDIYGGLIHTCQLFPNYTVDPVDIIHSFFHFTHALNESISSMASDPSRVCLCRDGTPDCLNVSLEETVYPGQTLIYNATVVGERFGAVKGIVYALPNPQNIVLEDFQYSQAGTPAHGYARCTELQYTISVSSSQKYKKQGLLVLSVNSDPVVVTPAKDQVRRDVEEYKRTGNITENLLRYQIHINITLLPCPLGFTLAQDKKDPYYPIQCVCDSQLQNIICNISDQTIHLSGTMWVNASFNESGSNGLIIGEYCPFDYCKSEEHDVNLNNPDTQCNFNHSGVLCGGCQPGLSLTLGSSQCLSCSDKYLVLLIPFAVAGIALVVFIVIFNLTVSEGTINGLIFYANIVGADRTIFFPAHQTNPLTVFIAWLNLDLGIETCFFDNLNAYWKTWLQFVFPLYIWTIIGIIIVLSKHSNFARKVFGSKSPHVLATLLLISYAKLLRTIISTLSFTYLEYPDHTRVAVWALDGNVRYLSGKHITLFVVALAFLLLLWLPLTAILLFWQVLQRLSHYKVIQWIVIKRKPFFDTYFGPLKDEHRYWVGLFLLIRSVLLIIFAVTPSYATKVDLLSINTIIVVLLVYIASLPHVEHLKEGRARNTIQPLSLSQKIREWLKHFSGSYYKNWCLSLLENSFLLNLGVLSAASLYIRSSGGNQAAVVYTSVSIAFAQFVGIVFFHARVALRNWRRKRMGRFTEQVQEERAGYEEIKDGLEDSSGIETLDFIGYREPILGHYD